MRGGLEGRAGGKGGMMGQGRQGEAGRCGLGGGRLRRRQSAKEKDVWRFGGEKLHPGFS